MVLTRFIANVTVGLLVGMAVMASPAWAAPLQITLTINFTSTDPTIPDLTSVQGAQFYWVGTDTNGDQLINPIINDPIDIGMLSQTRNGNSYFISFLPPNPCVSETRCELNFSFGGTAGGHLAYAFLTTPTAQPPDPPLLPLNIFYNPGPPDGNPGPPDILSGSIYAFSDPILVGEWQVTLQAATPLPAALPLFASGLGVMGLLGWRRKRKKAGAMA